MSKSEECGLWVRSYRCGNFSGSEGEVRSFLLWLSGRFGRYRI
jgi:hypothetical protein